MEEIPILEVIVERGQVKMEQEKIKAVKEWKTPIKVKDIERFPRICEFLLMLYPELQSYSKVVK